jgi:hypothetical protein
MRLAEHYCFLDIIFNEIYHKKDNKKAHKNVSFFKFGAPGAIRTPDPLVRSQILSLKYYINQ